MPSRRMPGRHELEGVFHAHPPAGMPPFPIEMSDSRSQDLRMPRLIEIAWFTDDVRATTEFYERLLGQHPLHRRNSMAEFDLGGVVLRIHEAVPVVDGEVPAEDHVAFAVENLDHSCAHAEANGLRCEFPPRTSAWGRSAYLRDPDGRMVELHETASAVE